MKFQEAIDSLGETAESIALALRAKNIKGYKASACRCPIAQYLNACGFPHVTVARDAKRYGSGQSEAIAVESICLPNGVRDWIADFDCGVYPEFVLF